jgi:hypothetical protein
MAFKLMTAAAAGALLLAQAAAAQPAVNEPATPNAPAAPANESAPANEAGAAAQPSADATDAELTAFAEATIKLHALTDRSPEAMSATIVGAGLSVDRYNEIAGRMSTDTAFAARVNAKLQQAQAPNEPGATAKTEDDPRRALATSLPTTGDGAVVADALSKVCLPLVREDKAIGDVAPKVGFKKDRRATSYTRSLGGKRLGVTIFPRGSNEAVCRVQIHHAVGGGQPIIDAVTIWAALADPKMEMRRNDVATGADGVKRRTLSWEGAAGTRQTGLVLVQLSNPDGTPLDKHFDTMTLLYSEQTAPAVAPAAAPPTS